MSFSFVSEKNLLSSEHQRRTVKPGTNEVFHWWSLAVPGPAYLGCVVKVVEVTDANNIKIVFFDPSTGSESTAVTPVAVNLSDLNSVFRTMPSTIDLPPPVQNNQFALLFFTETWLTNNAKPIMDLINANPQYLIKYPFADDGFLVETIKQLADGLRSVGKDPNSYPNFKQIAHRYPWL